MTLIVSWGGGVNSTAMLIGMHERGIIPDHILFADTGGEKPETYAYLKRFSNWLQAHGMPDVVTVAIDCKHVTLEQECLTQKVLPSLAYGWKKCSHKYKIEPLDKHVRTLGITDKPLWDYDCKDSVAFAVCSNAVVVACKSEIVALDLQDGKTLWSQAVPAAPVPWGLAVDCDGRVVVTLEDGQVLCLGSS